MERVMNVDAWDDRVRWEEAHQPQPDYIPGYDPDVDPMYSIAGKKHYSADLYIESQNYWATLTGRDEPPAPSYQLVHGRQKLGRYVDLYAAQAWLRWAKHEWRSKLWGIMILIAATLAFGLAAGIFDVIGVVLIVLPIWLYYRHYYVKYYRIQQRVLDSGHPQWVPYEWRRLRLIKRSSWYLWP
jgi:hypothetical protein